MCIRDSGNIGEASAMKMAYASITKGYSSLLIAAVMLSIKTNNFDSLMDELEYSQPRVFEDLIKLIGIPNKIKSVIKSFIFFFKIFI